MGDRTLREPTRMGRGTRENRARPPSRDSGGTHASTGEPAQPRVRAGVRRTTLTEKRIPRVRANRAQRKVPDLRRGRIADCVHHAQLHHTQKPSPTTGTGREW